MLRLDKFIQSSEGMKLFSIMLGLGIAGLFKMSCDSRSCLVYKGPEFKDDKKVVNVCCVCFFVFHPSRCWRVALLKFRWNIFK